MNNRIINSGGADGVGIDVQGKTKEITITNNQLKETRKPMQRTGVRIGKQARKIELQKNTIEGFAVEVSDQREK